jgi:riboflavin synthase
MFTGIVVERGVVRKVHDRGSVELDVEAPGVARELKKGDSVSVNGVCLTAVTATRRRFSTTVMPETLARSTLGDISKGSPVNLELAARIGDRIGGHVVQGHVDGVVDLARAEDDDGAVRMWFRADEDLLRYMVPKGSVALDGVSLTIVEVGRTTFQVAIIPHTLETTTLGEARLGTRVNVEVDMFAKYVERLCAPQSARMGER